MHIRAIIFTAILLTVITCTPLHSKEVLVTETGLQHAVMEFVSASLSLDNVDIEVMVDNVTPASRIPFKGFIDSIRFQGSMPSRSGKKGLTVLLLGTDGTPSKLYISAEINLYETVVVARRALLPSRVITKDDIFLARRKVGRGDVVYGLDEALGKVAKRTVQSNAVVKGSLLDLPVIVERNNKVTLILQRGNLKISTIGIAKEDGMAGKIIKVLNIDSNKTVYGKVLNSQVVLVDF